MHKPGPLKIILFYCFLSLLNMCQMYNSKNSRKFAICETVGTIDSLNVFIIYSF